MNLKFFLAKKSFLSYKNNCFSGKSLSEGLSLETTLVSDKARLVVDSGLLHEEETAFELGLWLSGLDSFLRLQNASFTSSRQDTSSSRDWTREFNLVNSVLLLCSKLNIKLLRNLQEGKRLNFVNFEELSSFSRELIDAALISEALLRGAPLRLGEWTAWGSFLSGKLRQNPAFSKIIEAAEKEAESFLPDKLVWLIDNKQIPFDLETDLRLLLPRFARILKWLDAIGKILDRDEFLKPTVLLFANLHEKTRELMRFINEYLLRRRSEEDELFAALDCAVYAISIELKKVYGYELVGFAESRQSPVIYARIETAHGLLNDSFQQTVVNFAKLIDPSVQASELFPNIERKLRQSLKLREDLWKVLQVVKAAEQNLEKVGIPKLHSVLNYFFDNSIKYLFYKDLETTERFIEEVINTREARDLVPILHRFGAYLETLFEQVNMRGVLADHPFIPPKDEVSF